MASFERIKRQSAMHGFSGLYRYSQLFALPDPVGLSLQDSQPSKGSALEGRPCS